MTVVFYMWHETPGNRVKWPVSIVYVYKPYGITIKCPHLEHARTWLAGSPEWPGRGAC